MVDGKEKCPVVHQCRVSFLFQAVTGPGRQSARAHHPPPQQQQHPHSQVRVNLTEISFV